MSYVLLNDPYVADGYTDSGYVGTENDFLYFELGYIGNLLQSSATLSIQSTISAVAQERDYASGTISIAATVEAVPVRIRPGSSALSVSSGFAIAARRIRTSTDTLNASVNISSAADRTRSSSSSVSGVFSPTVLAVARKVGEISVGSTSSVLAVASRTRSSTAEIVDAGNETPWSGAGTWGETTQGTWAKRVRVRGSVVFRNSIIDISISSSVSADPFRRRGVANIVIDGVGGLTALGGVNKPASATVSISATVDPIASETLTVGSATLSISSAVSSSAISKFTSSATLSSTGTVQGVAKRIQTGTAAIEATRDPKTITAYSITKTSTDVAKFGTHSVKYIGLFDYVRVSPDRHFGRGDFTVDMWIYKNGITTGTYTLFDNRSGSDGVVIRLSNNSIGVLSTGYSSFVFSPGNQFTNSTWHHLSFQRSGTDLQVFVDGSLILTTTVLTNNWSNRTASIGNLLTAPIAFAGGYIDEVRFSTGARYGGNFTPPTNPYSTDLTTRFLLHADDGFVDSSVPQNTVSARRILTSSAEILAAATVLSTSLRYQRGTIIAAANAVISAVPNRRRPGVSEANIESGISINGGKLLGIANEILAGEFSITRASGRFINIDPYRTIDVEPESRIRRTPAETRIIPVDLETGVNSVRAENRVIRVPAESRSWLIDIGTLTTISLDPIDRERI